MLISSSTEWHSHLSFGSVDLWPLIYFKWCLSYPHWVGMDEKNYYLQKIMCYLSSRSRLPHILSLYLRTDKTYNGYWEELNVFFLDHNLSLLPFALFISIFSLHDFEYFIHLYWLYVLVACGSDKLFFLALRQSSPYIQYLTKQTFSLIYLYSTYYVTHGSNFRALFLLDLKLLFMFTDCIHSL